MGDRNTISYKKGDHIFDEGTKDPFLYEIESGTVGIFKEYEMSSEIKLAELTEGYFGENGLINDSPRNATAVALTNDTRVTKIGSDSIKDYFTDNPDEFDLFIQTISKRIRYMDKKYLRACEFIDEYMTAEKNNNPQDPDLINNMRVLLSGK
ncbi:MAG: cyclic nucleotide-binding domain-containing protein [Lachnospiraceae bacterium]|nr:cyclic nucleotide-binding domain-containing protein [Lachnospiraceae bacterium]